MTIISFSYIIQSSFLYPQFNTVNGAQLHVLQPSVTAHRSGYSKTGLSFVTLLWTSMYGWERATVKSRRDIIRWETATWVWVERLRRHRVNWTVAVGLWIRPLDGMSSCVGWKTKRLHTFCLEVPVRTKRETPPVALSPCRVFISKYRWMKVDLCLYYANNNKKVLRANFSF